MTAAGFQRARTAPQRAQRRRDILAAAAVMLDEAPLPEISLRELARRVGLAKSNVVRYFPTREAVFLALLADDWQAWLDDLADQICAQAQDPPRAAGPAAHAAVAGAIAGTLSARRRLCGLIATAQTILERNIPVETAREFKAAALARTTRLAAITRAAVPVLTGEQAFEFAGAAWALTAGAWPMANPSPVVARVLAEPGFAGLCVDFQPALTRVLAAILDGMASRPQAGSAASAPDGATTTGETAC
ncbi:MAG: TetR/AcrR family transcriptional regulator [Streptosporangiaceae bacterium]